MPFVNRLRELRTKRGITQQALAQQAGISVFTVGRLDRDPHHQTTMRVMQKIAGALGVKVATVFREETCPQPS